MESLRSSDDFKDLLSAFNAEGVKYLIVGSFALAAYGKPRYTKDLDIWIDPAGENSRRVFRALAKFGAALDNLTEADLGDPDCVFQIGVEPIRVDILSGVSGLEFDAAWPRRFATNYGPVAVNVISREDYIVNKKASGRPSDLRDIEALLEDEAE